MSGIWIKICGITRAEDAEAVANIGADAVGIVLFSGSTRAVDVTQCSAILGTLDSNIERVALFVDPAVELVQSAIASNCIDLLQFHGNESVDFCEQFAFPYMKAIRVQSYEQAMADIEGHDSAKYILLDSYQKNVPGGTGKTFDWDIARRIVGDCENKIILAGGLDPNNVADAIKKVAPFGVDVSSGVEQSPGIKNLDKVKMFIKESKSV